MPFDSPTSPTRLPGLFSLSLLAAALFFSTTPLPAQAPEEISLEVIIDESAAGEQQDARAGLVSSLDQVPDEFWTHASYGDVILENGQAQLVLGGIPEDSRRQNISRQGNVIDLFSRPSSREGFQLIQPITQTDRRSVLVTEIDWVEDGEAGSATVTTFGEDTARPGVVVDTAYHLERGAPGALVTTTVTNNSDETVEIPILGDYILWGAMRPFAPGPGWNAANQNMTGIEYISALYGDSHVMIAPREGLFDVMGRGTHAIAVHGRDITLEPGESRGYERWFLTADGDPGRLYSHVIERSHPDNFGYMVGQVNERVRLPDGTHQVTRPVAGAEMRILAAVRRDLPEGYFGRPYVYTMTDDDGRFQISLPAGDYTVSAATPGRPFEVSTDVIRIQPNRVSAVDHVVPEAAGLVYEIVDAETGEPLAGKISFLPLRGSSTPNLGPAGALESANTVYSLTGRGFVEVPEGNYRVVASHGVEYHTDEKRVRISHFNQEMLRFELRRAFDTTGWISADLGVLTDASPTSRISAEDRVVTAIAEGLDWIVTADAGTATNLQPIIERLGKEAKLRATPGMRLVGTAGAAIGDYTIFPADACSGLDHEAILAANTPGEAIDILRSLCPTSVLLLNRAVFPTQGALTILGYDFAGNTWPEEPIYLDVDGIQVWEGKRQGIVTRSLDVHRELLAQGNRATPFGNSLSPGTQNQEAGYPRVYLPSETKDPRRLDIDALSAAFREGRAMITNGPFIDARINGRPMGSQVTETGGHIEMELAVHTPNWANVSSITVNVNGSFARKFIQPAGSYDREKGQVFPNPEKPEEGTFTIPLRRDAIVQVIVEGDPQLDQDPVNPHSIPSRDPSTPQGQYTLAISAPFFIDADGDGAITIDSRRVREPQTEHIPAF